MRTTDEKESILIVDDDVITCRSLELAFSRKGYKTEIARTGFEAIEKVKDRFFNVALLDIKLPDMEGTELLAPLKELHPHIDVIMVTAFASLATATRALNEGAFAYITKPVNMDEVLATIREALEKQRLLEEKQRAEKQVLEALSDLKKSNDELKSTQLQLIKAERLETVGRLAAGIAHEVKNPLAIVLMGVDYLTKHTGNGNTRVDSVLKDMNNAVLRADSIIQGLLDFSASRELDSSVEELNSVVEQSLLLVKHDLDKYHIAVVKELSENLPLLKLDRNKIEQVFVNVFTNGIHAMPNGGTLSVKTHASKAREMGRGDRHSGSDRVGFENTAIVADVEDSGTGIPENHLAKIFDPFFTTKPTRVGTGLGLTVAQRIIELHGGTIEITNRKEGGVAVSLIFEVPKEEG